MNQRDRDILEQWFFQYSSKLFLLARLKVDHDLAEEAVQETFRIATEIGSLEKIVAPFPWLRKILSNVLSNKIRQQEKWRKMIASLCDIPMDLLATYEDPINIELEYEGVLRKEDLHLLILLAIHNYTYKEAADELHITPEACRKRARRAEAKMEKYLKKRGF